VTSSPLMPPRSSDDLDGLPLGRRRIAYLALATATTMAVLDGTIANTALLRIAQELHASPITSIWVVNGFQLAAGYAHPMRNVRRGPQARSG